MASFSVGDEVDKEMLVDTVVQARELFITSTRRADLALKRALQEIEKLPPPDQAIYRVTIKAIRPQLLLE